MKINFLRQFVLRHAQLISKQRPPDFVVGEPSDPYLRRWYLTPKALRWLGAIYLHEFCKDDDDVPHDHPYLWNMSWVLQIGYFEDQFTPTVKKFSKRKFFTPDYRQDLERKWRPEGTIICRWGWTAHRIKLKQFRVSKLSISDNFFVLSFYEAASGMIVEERIPHPITIFVCGPRVREWGFYCPQGWKSWKDYIAPTSYGNRVGKGCE